MSFLEIYREHLLVNQCELCFSPRISTCFSLSFCELPYQVSAFQSSHAPDTCVALLGAAGLEHFSFILSKRVAHPLWSSLWSWMAPALPCCPPSWASLPSAVVDWFRELKRRVLGCGDISAAAFQSAVHRVCNVAALVSPHQEIPTVPVRLRLLGFKMLFPSA